MINKRLMHLMGESGRYIIKNVFWQWCILLSSIVSAIVSVKLISDFDFKTISIRDAGYFIIIAVSLFTRFFASRMAAAASCMSGKEVKKVLRTGLYKKLVGLGASYHEKVPTAEALQVAVDGIEQLEVYFGSYLPQLFYSILAPLTLFIVLSFYSFRASLILLVCVPMIPVSIVAVQSIAKRLLNKYWGIYTGLGDHFLENLQGLSILKLYGRELQRGVQMDEEAERFRKITMKVLMMQLNSIIIMDIIAYGGAALGMAVCLIELKNGRIDFFSFLTLVFLSADFFIPMRLLGSYFHVAMNGMAALDRLFAIMDLPSDGSAGKDIAVNNFVSGFKMENVSFSYKGSNEDKVLDGFSMEIPRKGMASLTGLSGCGKSTVAGLLSGRYKGYDGSIRLSGTELSDISEKSLMQAVTLVRHDSYIFNTSIRDNLLAAAPDASDKRLYEVLDETGLLDCLNSRDGLDTEPGQCGASLSGGQKQRLCIARALLHNTPFYIFDEAASNIDAESEERIMKVIRALSSRCGVLLITHRLKNAEGSKCIYMMKDGHAIEKGTHEELMELNKEYAELYKKQEELESYALSARKNENIKNMKISKITAAFKSELSIKTGRERHA